MRANHGHGLLCRSRGAKAQIGYLPDTPFFYDYLTGWELLRFIAEVHRLEPAESVQRAERLLGELQLTDAGDDFVTSYSLGMKKKMALALALMHEPRVLILDEPTTGLDPQSSRHIREFIRSYADAGRTVLLSTHWPSRRATALASLLAGGSSRVGLPPRSALDPLRLAPVPLASRRPSCTSPPNGWSNGRIKRRDVARLQRTSACNSGLAARLVVVGSRFLAAGSAPLHTLGERDTVGFGARSSVSDGPRRRGSTTRSAPVALVFWLAVMVLLLCVKWFKTFEDFARAYGVERLRGRAIFLSSLTVASLLLMALSGNRALDRQQGDDVEWLSTLPAPAWVLHAAKLAEAALLNPFGWLLLFPFFTGLGLYCGLGLLAPLVTLGVCLPILLCCALLGSVVDSTQLALSQSRAFRVVRVLGPLLGMFVFVASLAAPALQVLNLDVWSWLDAFPEPSWLPFAEPARAMLAWKRAPLGALAELGLFSAAMAVLLSLGTFALHKLMTGLALLGALPTAVYASLSLPRFAEAVPALLYGAAGLLTVAFLQTALWFSRLSLDAPTSCSGSSGARLSWHSSPAGGASWALPRLSRLLSSRRSSSPWRLCRHFGPPHSVARRSCWTRARGSQARSPPRTRSSPSWCCASCRRDPWPMVPSAACLRRSRLWWRSSSPS